MIKRYKYGTVIQTDAVVSELDVTVGEVAFLGQYDETAQEFRYGLDAEDLVYGLGENVRGINKRGWLYESRCLDDPHHLETCNSLYASHNFFMISGAETFGVFMDYPGIVSFDIGYTRQNELVVHPEDSNFDLYIIEGKDTTDIVMQFRSLIGRSYIPPKWAFGYQQSRWGYTSAEDVREVVSQHRENHIPLDSVYMDIDYMERYKDFTVDEERFPDFKTFVEEMKTEHIHLVPIIDAGVKVEEGYPFYEEGVEREFFCKNADGTDFVAGVWPGRVHFPDVLNPDARKWFGHGYKFLLDQGIDGFWNDMNEPSIFYSEEHFNEVLDSIGEFKGKNLDLEAFSAFTSMVEGLANNRDDYKRFYHKINGEMVRHDRVHNLFGYNMTRAAGEAFEEFEPDKRILMFSRSSYTGMHRYGGIWMGDNMSWWGHILMNYKMLPSLNMMGLLYSGCDVGGFSGNATEDLVMRWIEAAIFTPLMRNHSSMDTRNQEVYRFDQLDSFKKLIECRYALVPYIYSEFVKAALTDTMYFRPLSFIYTEDKQVKEVEDQLMVGESLMSAPIYTQNATGRYVYLPEEMLLIRMRSCDDYDTEVMEAGHHYVKARMDEMIFFLRKNYILPIGPKAESIAELDDSKVRLITFQDQDVTYDLYDDDGYSTNYDLEGNITTIKISKNGTCTVTGSRNLEVTVETYSK